MPNITIKQLEYLINEKGKQLREYIKNEPQAPAFIIKELQEEIMALRAKLPKKETPLSDEPEPATKNQ